MISDPVLRKIVGADLFFAAARADLRLAMGRILGLFFALLFLQEARAHDAERSFFVLLLAATVLAAHNSSGRNVENLHRGIGCVDTLSTRAARAANLNPQIFRLQIEIDFLRLGQHGHGRSRSMNATLRLGCRNALHAVNAAFKTQLPKNVFARDLENRFFQPT